MNYFKMTQRSYHFDCQYRRYCFQITYFLVFSVILLGYFSSGVQQPRTGSCSELPTYGQLVRCGYNSNSCILNNFTCDKIKDCSDGSDESYATCGGGLACEEKPEPVCLNGGTCRSVVQSATRLAYHECGCIAPFTGAKCSEVSTTILSPTADPTRVPSTSSAVGVTPTIVSSKYGSTTQGITSQTSTTPQTDSTLLQTDSTLLQTESTSLQTEHSTLPNINSSPMTNNQTLPQKQQTDESMTNITSQSSSNITTSTQTTPQQQQTDESMTNITSQSSSNTTFSHTTTSFTEVSNKTEEKSTLPVHPPPPRPPKQTTKPATTTKKSSTDQKPNTSSSDVRFTIILVVFFGLMFLIPVAIFIHCRMKRKPSNASLSQKSKKDDKEILTQNNKMDLSNKTQEVTKAKTNHQRNVSISSIKMKENSNLLGNEMPLDVNMNRPQPAPPVIRVTYAPDVYSDPPVGSSLSTNTDITDQPHYPETQMWMPGEGSEETPYFVTSHGPLPVSLV